MNSHGSQHSEKNREKVTSSIRIGEESKLLGSPEAVEELIEGEFDTPLLAREELSKLVEEGYLPVFPMDRAEAIDALMDEGLTPKSKLMEKMDTVVGTIGRPHLRGKSRFLVVILEPEKIADKIAPRFTGKNGRTFVGAVSPLGPIGKEHIMILDPDTLEVLHAPEHVREMQDMRIMIHGETRSLGSLLREKQLEAEQFTSDDAVNREFSDLIKHDYLPVFPLSADMLEEVKKDGLMLGKTNVSAAHAWRGTLGRTPGKGDYLVVIVDRHLVEKALMPVKTRGGAFVGGVEAQESIPPRAIAIIDTKTQKLVSAPEGVEFEKGEIRGVVESVREKVQKAA
ncbi:MAG TPA: hypothetical protein VI588_03740 [Candidatus Gracilibacteria bacterium]|nr:hypothetical protein [Candidatus Gracilibacteria bacterium]